MDLGSTYDKGMQWVFAVSASIALHVVILVAFALGSTGGCDATHTHDAPKEAEAAVSPAVSETPSPAEEPKVEEKTRSESKPKAEAKPKIVDKPKAEAKGKVEDKAKAEAKTGPEDEAMPKAGSLHVATKAYVVKKGDTLKHIAQGCGCTMQDLADLNDMPVKKLANLKVGQKIKVPKGGLD